MSAKCKCKGTVYPSLSAARGDTCDLILESCFDTICIVKSAI